MGERTVQHLEPDRKALGPAETMQVETIPTGKLGLDFALGVAGLPRGRVIEIYGP